MAGEGMALGILIAFVFFLVLVMSVWGAYENNRNPARKRGAALPILLMTLTIGRRHNAHRDI
jgi:hypothetical protein